MVTAVTAQNSLGTDAIEMLSADIVVAQINSVCTDMEVGAIKTGMLGSPEMVATVAHALPVGIPVVVDPVMVATTGAELFSGPVASSSRAFGPEKGWGPLLSRATVVTPNAHEAEALTGIAVGDDDAMERAARAILDLGCQAVLLKGGHVGSGAARDCLIIQAQPGPVWLEAERVAGDETHGTGCVLSAAITARLAHGDDIASACRLAKLAVTEAIRRRVKTGRGVASANPSGI